MCLCTESIGLSAAAILGHGKDHPHDPEDLCRCLHVSWEAPIHMRGVSPEWTALVDWWDVLRRCMALERPSGRAPITYALMRELLKRARATS